MNPEDEELARKISQGYGQTTGTQPYDVVGSIIKALMGGPSTFREGAQYVTEGMRAGNAMLPGLTFAGPKAAGWATAPRKFSSLVDKKPRFEISDEAMKLMQEKHVGKLGDLIQHDELFSNYPWLRNVNVAVSVTPGPSSGSYLAKTPGEISSKFTKDVPYISVFGSSKEEVKNSLVHEIQHAIQEYEGFARGGSPESLRAWANRIPDTKEAISFWGENVVSAARRARNLGTDEAYRKLAGEIESRDAAFRRLYSDYERSHTQPGASQNIPLGQEIVRGVEGKQQWLPVESTLSPKPQPANKGLDLETGQWIPVD